MIDSFGFGGGGGREATGGALTERHCFIYCWRERREEGGLAKWAGLEYSHKHTQHSTVVLLLLYLLV